MERMSDKDLINLSLSGDRQALEQLIARHQDYIYNLALTFVGDRDEALDLTQEVLIKAVTKLSTFKFESEFRTWLYRIVKNHFLNMQRGKFESQNTTFESFGQGLDQAQDRALDGSAYQVEEQLIVEEVKISCMKGMLLCLDREQRLIFLLGELFEFSDRIGAEVMGLTKENFRVKLHRAKKQLYGFMNDKCGLINKKNPCKCARKTTSFIEAGFVDPNRLVFQSNAIGKVMDHIEDRVEAFSGEIESEYQKLYQSHPFLQSPEGLLGIKNLLDSPAVKNTFNFN